MYYSFKNCEVLLDGQQIYADSLGISLDASIEGVFEHGKNLPKYYSAQGGLAGSARISYYITGEDLLRDYFADDTRFVSLYFGGLSFQSGCITSYSINGKSNSAVVAEADISFYGDINGLFTPTYKPKINLPYYNYSDCFISGDGVGDLTSVTSFSYKASMNVEASYKDQGKEFITPDCYSFNNHQATLTLNYDNLTGRLPVSGRDAIISIRRGSINIIPQISGKVISKSIDIASNNGIESAVTIKQDNIIAYPEIYGFGPTGGAYGTTVTITGVNFRPSSKKLSVLYGDNPLNGVSVLSNNIIRFNMLVRSPISGNFTVITQGGIVSSTGYYTIDNGSIGAF